MAQYGSSPDVFFRFAWPDEGRLIAEQQPDDGELRRLEERLREQEPHREWIVSRRGHQVIAAAERGGRWLFVPEGRFIAGGWSSEKEVPVRVEETRAFWIAHDPVTVGEFGEFVGQGYGDRFDGEWWGPFREYIDIILKKRILKDVVSKISISDYMGNFLNILLDKDRFVVLTDIMDAYKGILDEASGRVRANITSATELEEIQLERIAKALSEVVKKEVDVDVTIEPSLIGGVVAEVEGMVYDGSVKTQISRLKQSLKGEM